MQIDLDADEIETLIEGLDYYKTKVAYVKGSGTYAEKTEKLKRAEMIEQKLRDAVGKST
jgi:endonuclease III-like uncharacterized protein